MIETVMKKEDRATLNVSIETRNKLQEIIFEFQADFKMRMTQDDAIDYLIKFYRMTLSGLENDAKFLKVLNALKDEITKVRGPDADS